MAYTMNILSELNFSYTQVAGSLDDKDLHLLVLAFQIESKGLKYVREILDLRQTQDVSGLTVEGLVRLSELERKRSPDRDARMAILTNDPIIRRVAEAYAYVNTRGNFTVTCIDNDVDGALDWLGYDSVDKNRVKLFVAKHTRVMETPLAD